MNYSVGLITEQELGAWDAYVKQNNMGTYCHLSGWKTVIEKAYGMPTYFWVCRDSAMRLVGLLPTVHLKHILFGNSLVSMPYLDKGGILSDDFAVRERLLAVSKNLALQRNIPQIELRQPGTEQCSDDVLKNKLLSDTAKVQMIVTLPEKSEILFKRFKKDDDVRTEIRKATKLGIRYVLGGSEYLDDFYEVFATNMRDLGSPVHSRLFFEWVCRIFKDFCQVGVAYHESKPIASGIIFTYRDTVSFPFGGSLRSHNHLKAFPLLIWQFLKNACDSGYRFFDFGRSSFDSGPYKFKERWGAKPYLLQWQYVELSPGANIMETRSKLTFFSKIWQKLPISVTNFIGPPLRKYISL